MRCICLILIFKSSISCIFIPGLIEPLNSRVYTVQACCGQTFDINRENNIDELYYFAIGTQRCLFLLLAMTKYLLSHWIAFKIELIILMFDGEWMKIMFRFQFFVTIFQSNGIPNLLFNLPPKDFLKLVRNWNESRLCSYSIIFDLLMTIQ